MALKLYLSLLANAHETGVIRENVLRLKKNKTTFSRVNNGIRMLLKMNKFDCKSLGRLMSEGSI